jgi:hypothetical protein
MISKIAFMTAKAGVRSHRLEPTRKYFPRRTKSRSPGEIGKLNLIPASRDPDLPIPSFPDFQRAMGFLTESSIGCCILRFAIG